VQQVLGPNMVLPLPLPPPRLLLLLQVCLQLP
jgi:hypothetical protein